MNIIRSHSAASIRWMLRHGAIAAVVFTVCPAVSQEWKAEKNVEIVVSSGPGGAADRSARALQKFLQPLPGMPSVTVTNRPGGGGTVAWSFVNQHPGDGHYLSTLNTALVTNQVMGLSHLRYQDVTPLVLIVDIPRRR